MHEIEDLRSSAKITELTMGNLLTKSEKTQYRDKRSPKGCFGRLFRKKNSKVSYTRTVYTRENKPRLSEGAKRLYRWYKNACSLYGLAAFCRS